MSWSHWMQRAASGKKGLASLALGLAFVVGGMGVSLPASGQISGTKHNLGSNGTGVNKFSGTTEICVFCHTPHGSDTSAAVPLWNRTLVATGFTTYDSLGTTSLNGKVATVGSVSVACLSCHDGTQSMSAVINAPGSGKAGDATWLAGTWSGANQSTGTLVVTAITNLGKDLRNDHPIGIQYGGGGITASVPAGLTSTTSGTNDPDFKKPASTTLNGARVWWVDTEATANGSRQKTDMVLYTRASTAGYTGQTDAEPFVECASCHDPHTSNATFLRIANTSSAVCLSCHVK